MALNPSLQPELNLYKKAVLQSDEHVVYPEKSSLKRSIPLWSTEHTAFKTAYRAAAAVVVLFSAYTVLQVIQNDTIYTPRTDGFTWENTSTIDEGSPLNNNATTGSTPSSTNTTTSLLAQATPTTKRAEVTKIPVLTGGLTNSPSASMPVESREMVAYHPTIPQGLEDVEKDNEPETYYASNEPLNLNQFVGKEFLGLDPGKTKTTTSLIREGLIKAIDESAKMDLAAQEDKDRKSLEFLAGNFGIKRVKYE